MIIRSVAATAAIGLALCFVAGSAVRAGPSMTTNWTATTLSNSECMDRARRIVRDADIGKVDVIGHSVFGQGHGYTAVVRCIPEKGLVYFVVGGPKLDGAKERMRKLFDRF
jgi:hypothetical protein